MVPIIVPVLVPTATRTVIRVVRIYCDIVGQPSGGIEMTKPMPKPESTAFGLVLVFGLIIAGLAKSLGTLGPTTALIICVVGIGAFIGLKVYQSKARLAYLRNKYGNEAIVQGIIQHRFWGAKPPNSS